MERSSPNPGVKKVDFTVQSTQASLIMAGWEGASKRWAQNIISDPFGKLGKVHDKNTAQRTQDESAAWGAFFPPWLPYHILNV